MTDHHDSAHLDDELLSAVLDGEAAVDASTHSDACDRCRARLAVLRDVSVLVAAPVPPADAVRRDAAIEAAMTAMDRTVVPMRRRRTPPTWLAAAAAVVIAVGAISLLSRGTNDDAGFDTATGASDETSGGAGTDQDAFALAAPATVDGGDLGEVDAATLRQRIDEAFGAQRTSPAAESTQEMLADDGAATMLAPAPVPCEQEIRDGSPDLGALVYRASGTIDGVPVIVLAFDVPPDRWVYVATIDGCAIRNQQTYSP